MTINLRNVWGKRMGFVLLAFVIGATISQGSFAFADDSATNPFRAIWDAIGELQVKTDALQAQIDDLRAQQGTTTAVAQVVRTSDGSITTEVGGGGSGQTIVTLITRNAGPDNSVGTKLTVFYQRSLLQINFIEGADCTDGSRGIIECYLGTLEAGSERRVIIDATPISLGQQAIITADFSSITRDANPTDNHVEAVFITAIAPVAQPAPAPAAPSGGGSAPVEQAPAEQVPEQQSEEQGTEVTQETGGEQTSQETEQTDQSTGEESESGEQGEDTSETGGDTGSSEGGSSDSGGSEGGSSGDSGSEGGSSGGDSGTTG